MMTRVSFPIVAATVAMCVTLCGAPGGAERVGPVEHLVARAPGGRVDILIDHWSSDQEREDLRSALVQRGPDMLLGLLRTIRRPAGFVRFPGRQGLGARARTRRAQNLHFARQIDASTGRQLILATDQQPGFDDPARYQHAPGNAFTLIDIRFGPDGTGVGKLGMASAVTQNERTHLLELERYAGLPVTLSGVRSVKQ